MRIEDILFRGKTKVDGKWIYGSLLQTDNGTFVIQNYVPFDGIGKYEVDSETVCQYTGLTDKNGRKIFEGDIASFDYELNDLGKIAKILFEDGEYRYRAVTNSPELYNCRICGENDRCKVIGNIFDNPELMEE